MDVINSHVIYLFIFSIGVFFHYHSRITGLQGKREGISLTPHYHFHPLHRHDYCRERTSAHRLQPDSNREPLVSESKSLTTKLRALDFLLLRNTHLKLMCRLMKKSVMESINFVKLRSLKNVISC